MRDSKIEKIEAALVGKKDWKYRGEIKASLRPQNSLVGENVEFETAIFNVPISSAQNNDIFKYVQQRFKEKTFDNYEFKEIHAKAEVETYDITLCETNKEILALYDDIESILRKHTDYGNDGF